MSATPDEIQARLDKNLDDLITPEDEAPSDRHHHNRGRGGTSRHFRGRGRLGGGGERQRGHRPLYGGNEGARGGGEGRGEHPQHYVPRGEGGRGGGRGFYHVGPGPGPEMSFQAHYRTDQPLPLYVVGRGRGRGGRGGHPRVFVDQAPGGMYAQGSHGGGDGRGGFNNGAAGSGGFLDGGSGSGGGRGVYSQGYHRQQRGGPVFELPPFGDGPPMGARPGGIAGPPRRPHSETTLLFKAWSEDGSEVSVDSRHVQILVLKAREGTVTLNPGRKARDTELLLGLNVVLSLLGMEVFVRPRGEEGQEEQGEEWFVRKGSWSQVLEDGMTVSAFASREWPKVASALQIMPTKVSKNNMAFVAPPPPPPPATGTADAGGELDVSVLGKRGGGGEGGEVVWVQRGGGRGGGRGRGRGRGVNLWAGSNKWVRT